MGSKEKEERVEREVEIKYEREKNILGENIGERERERKWGDHQDSFKSQILITY